MKGFIVTNRKKNEIYSGFDVYESWIYLEEWNKSNPQKRIDLIDDAYYENDLSNLYEYYHFTKDKNPEKKINLIYFDSNLDSESKFKIDSFLMIGYDCGYIVNEEGIILYSSILHEIRGANLFLFNEFKSLLNKYFLFNELSSCINYINIRMNNKDNPKLNLETAYNEMKLQIAKIYLFNE